MSDNKKIALCLMYDGGKFHGWQVQQNAKSVQSTIQDALENVLGFRPDVCGCSRTDSGVHANNYVCHIDGENVSIPCDKLPKALNAHLHGSGLCVKSAEEKDKDFHARYSCIGKEYVYKIWNNDFVNPFLENYSFYYPMKIDVEKYSYLCREFEGTHDFRAFMSKGSKNEDNTVRTVKYFRVKREEDGLVTVSVCADGFLYNMVRIMVGTYLECVRNDAPKGTVSKIIDSLERKNAGDTAPAHALYINKIFYQESH